MSTSALALPVGDDALARRLEDRMAFVEGELARHVRSRTPYVTEAASHLLAAGGKRFRPLLVLLTVQTPAEFAFLTQAVLRRCTSLRNGQTPASSSTSLDASSRTIG